MAGKTPRDPRICRTLEKHRIRIITHPGPYANLGCQKQTSIHTSTHLLTQPPPPPPHWNPRKHPVVTPNYSARAPAVYMHTCSKRKITHASAASGPQLSSSDRCLSRRSSCQYPSRSWILPHTPPGRSSRTCLSSSIFSFRHFLFSIVEKHRRSVPGHSDLISLPVPIEPYIHPPLHPTASETPSLT